jgi:hypothetical protein
MNLRLLSILLIALGLLMTAGAGVAQTTQYGQVRNNAGQVTLTRWSLQHIMARHWPDSTAAGAGKFQAGITEASLRDMINEAVVAATPAIIRTDARGRSTNTIFSIRSGRRSMAGQLLVCE